MPVAQALAGTGPHHGHLRRRPSELGRRRGGEYESRLHLQAHQEYAEGRLALRVGHRAQEISGAGIRACGSLCFRSVGFEATLGQERKMRTSLSARILLLGLIIAFAATARAQNITAPA